MRSWASPGYEQIAISNIINSQFPDFIAEHPGWVNIDYHFLGIDLIQTPWSAVSSLSTGITLAAVGLILIPIISGVFSFLLSKVSMSQSAQTAAANGSTKMMMWMMPLMSIYIAFIVPAALGVYWAAQSAFSIIQEMVLGKFYTKKLQEEEDARQEMIQADRQKRMEEAKLLQEQQRQQAAQKKSLKEKRPGGAEAKALKAKKGGHQHHGSGPCGRPALCPRPVLQGGRYDDQ